MVLRVGIALEVSPPPSPLQMTMMLVAANNAAYRRRAPSMMEISCIAGVGPSRREGLPWSSLAARQPPIESNRAPSLAPLRPAKTIRAIPCPAGERTPSRGSARRLSRAAPQMSPADEPRSARAPPAFAEKPTIIIHSLWPLRDAVMPWCETSVRITLAADNARLRFQRA